MSTTTNLSTLKINYLTQGQYENALENNLINEDELYLTPGSGLIAYGYTDPSGGEEGDLYIKLGEELPSDTTKAALEGHPVIPDNTVFNSLVNPGTYYVPNATSASTMANSPFTNSGFMMYVIKPLDNNDNYKVQYAMTWRGDIKTRYTYDAGTTWTAWASNYGKHIMTASLNSSITSPTAVAFTKLPLSTYNSSGWKLTFDSTNGGIKIGSNVNKILISGSIALKTGTTAGTRYLVIVKNSYNSNNSNTLDWILRTVPVSTAEEMLVTHPVLVDVTDNDIIYIFYYVRSGDQILGDNITKKTSLTVEVVE